MHISMKKYALVGCATFMVAGCASQQNFAPQYRLSAPTSQAVEGTSMLQRGRAQLDAGLDALAIESFRAEIRFNPDSVDAYNGLAVAYGRIGRNDLAQRYFEMALSKDPFNVKVQANLAKLPGNEGLAIQQAESTISPELLAPIAVTVEAKNESGEILLPTSELPAFATAPMLPEATNATPLAEILPKRGVLSARFAIAAAGATVGKARSDVVLRSGSPVEPVRLPVRPSERPVPYLQSDIRVGARLERVSLHEVRLITLASKPLPRSQPVPSFDSFGERIALWLPAYMTAEQAASRYRGDETRVVMAVAERSDATPETDAMSPKLIVEPSEFAYVIFDDINDVVGT